MSDFALEHRNHEIEFEIRKSMLGTFVYAFCEDCQEELGNLNITVILDHMEFGD